MRHDGKESTRSSARLRLMNPTGCVSPSAACGFLCFSAAEQMFWEVMRLRREMSTARLGFYVADQG